MDVTVAIGRNVFKYPKSPAPMNADKWVDFGCQVDQAIADNSIAVHFTGEGTGIYAGRAEDSRVTIFTVADNVAPRLKRLIAAIGSCYGQESIAWLEGFTQFVSAS